MEGRGVRGDGGRGEGGREGEGYWQTEEDLKMDFMANITAVKIYPNRSKWVVTGPNRYQFVRIDPH